jgi:hypothetical protein
MEDITDENRALRIEELQTRETDRGLNLAGWLARGWGLIMHLIGPGLTNAIHEASS